MIARAERGSYGTGSVRELPARLAELALRSEGEGFHVDDAFRNGMTFRCEDIRRAMPEGRFDVVMCRNMLLTYVSEDLHVGAPRADRDAPLAGGCARDREPRGNAARHRGARGRPARAWLVSPALILSVILSPILSRMLSVRRASAR